MSSNRLPLSIAFWDYDRTKPMIEGKIGIDGVEPRYVPLWVEETFFRMLHNAEFDVSEMSFAGYIVSLSEPDPKFIAIPVFPSRTFRQRSIYVNKNNGIKSPSDLKGKTVGMPRYRQTAGVYIRGMLEDYYGVPASSIKYVTGGLEERVQEGKLWSMSELNSKLKNDYGINVTQESEKSLSAMLDTGEIDAIYTARMPSTFNKPNGNVERLFPDYRREEIEYFSKTGIFPIMHTMVIRRDVYEENPWVASSLVKAFERSKNFAYTLNYQTGALRYMLPWMNEEIEIMENIIGKDYWPYGIEKNRKTLDAFLDYMHRQGLSNRHYKPEEIFATETLEMFRIDSNSPANL
jgi:4,5-dihydroxyphthalate decarboxylase